MKNKSIIMTVAALQILIFHLWIPVFPGSDLENFIRQSFIVGVDIFFFMSGIAMSSSRTDNYRQFIGNRFETVYLKFAIFSVVAWLYRGWSVGRLISVLAFIDLLKKGGGAHLWFLPAIMMFYLVFPWIKKVENHIKPKNKMVVPLVVLAMWFVVGILVTNLSDYKAMFIWWNRIPIFILGYYWGCRKSFTIRKKYEDKEKLKSDIHTKICSVIISVIELLTGYIMIYFFAYRSKLQVFIVDIFYLTLMPAALGLTMLLNIVDSTKTSKIRGFFNKIASVIGKSTLELYAIQMIFGYAIADWIFKRVRFALLSNIITIIIVCSIAVGINYTYRQLQGVGKTRK